MKSTFKQPKAYDDMLVLYKAYWDTHYHLPRAFKLTTGEGILQEITACIKGIILANHGDKNNPVQRKQAAEHLGAVRASLVVIRGMLTVGWGMKFIAHGAFMRLTTHLDGIEKQVTSWQRWFVDGVGR